MVRDEVKASRYVFLFSQMKNVLLYDNCSNVSVTIQVSSPPTHLDIARQFH